MITSQYFNITSDASIFASNRHIANKQHCSIWVKSLSNVWTQIPYNDYDLVNNSIILDTALLSTIYSQVELRVADSQEELGTPVTDISKTASIRDEVIVVADNIDSITTVSDNITNLNNIADNIVKAGVVADNIIDVNNVADNITSISSLASIRTQLESLYADKTKLTSIYNDKITLDSIYSDKSKLDAIFSDLNTIEGLYGIKAKLESIYADKSKLDSIYADKTQLDTIYNNISNILTVYSSIANVITVSNNIASVNTTASNIVDVNTFSSKYKISATQPSSPTAGNLWYDISEAVLKYYNGTFWVAVTPDLNAFQTALNTKVDKITSTDNAIVRFDLTSGQIQNSGVIIDDSNNVNTSGSIYSANMVGFKNYIINGNFDIWQYKDAGLTYPQTASGYGSDDRWFNGNVGSTKTHSQVACTDTEIALFNASKFSRTVVSSVAGASNYCNKSQAIENVTKLAGKTVTLSFWARADSSKSIGFVVEQCFGTGGSPSNTVGNIGSQLISLTTNWQKKTITLTIPSIVGKVLGTDGVHTTYTSIKFGFDIGSNYSASYGGLGQQSGTFDIAQVQLEEGSVATPFEQRPYGLELSLCQRYYSMKANNSSSITLVKAGGTWSSTLLKFPVNMRVIPTVLVGGSQQGDWTGGAVSALTEGFRYTSSNGNVGSIEVTSYTASAEL